MIYQTKKKERKQIKKVRHSKNEYIYIYKNLFPFNYLNRPEITFNTYILKEKFFIFHVDDEELKS